MQPMTGFDLTFYLTRTILVPNENLEHLCRSAELDRRNSQPITPPVPTPDDLRALSDKIASQQLDIQALRLLIDQQGKQLNTFRMILVDHADQLAQRQAPAPVAALDASQKSNTLTKVPPLDQITRLQIQFWNNVTKKKQAKASKQPGPKYNYQLELYIWNCPKDEIRNHREGNCGKMFIPLYRPHEPYARKNLGHDLDYMIRDLPVLPKFIGCLNSPCRQPNQAAMVLDNNKLIMAIDGEVIDCWFPKERSDPGAGAIHDWFWPDVARD